MRAETYAVTIPAGGSILKFRVRNGEGDVVPFRTQPSIEVVSGVGNGRAEISGLGKAQCHVRILDDRGEPVERFVRVKVSGGAAV